MKKGSILFGVIIILTSLLFIGISVSSAVLSTTIKLERSYKSISALSLAEAGINKALFELNSGNGSYGNASTTESLNTGEFNVSVTNCQDSLNCKYITSTGFIPSQANFKSKKTVRVKITDIPDNTGIAFSYGVQAGPLGIVMSNNSRITGTNGAPGNVYAQGTILGGNNTVVTGDVIMAGASGKIEKVTINGTAKAHNIIDSVIGGNAYYQSIDARTSVGGTKYPGSPDPSISNLPITDSIISEWESKAALGGTYSGDLNLQNDPVTGEVALGPIRIDGDLTATIGTKLRITGTIWVTGNINLANNMIIVLDPDYGNKGGLVIADNPTDKGTYGKIITSNNVKVCGSISFLDCENNTPVPGNTSSIMFLSTNSGSTISNPAIIASNNSTAVIYYTTTGMLEVSNNGGLKAFTGGGLHLSNGAQVTYDQGLASSEFSGGPGGRWTIREWQILYD